ncbi:MAG: ABC transporter ATP-binding protein [Alphaproteobacteria bacterium]|nr:ABC transporter ATP-binding protein [Alphaproteobacteria bacterium]
MLVLDNVHARYGSVNALSGVSMTVEPGELVALVGANGAGKSTVLRTVSGLMRPHLGTITFNKARIDRQSASEIVKLGIAHCPEERKIWPQMTVEENLEMGAYLRRDKAGIAATLAKMLDRFPRLHERRRQMAGTLSGGEQQMLAIARALMSAPQLVMFDEPSLGLSPILVQEVVAIIRDIYKDGVTVLLVEQNVNMALRLASRAYVLETGRVAVSGDSRDLLKDDSLLKAYLGG